MKDAVIVIGGGAAGLMAASAAAEAGRAVLVLERGEQAGRKVLASGGGRCNFTTDRSASEFLAAFPATPSSGASVRGAGRFLKHAVHTFPPEELRGWFRRRGLESVVEDRRCVFPQSGRSRDVLAVLLEAARYKETLRTLCAGREICVSDGRVVGVETSDGRRMAASSVIVATGGPAWPQAGGTSSGLELLSKCGHRITELRPGLAPLVTGVPGGSGGGSAGGGWWRDVPGVTLEDVGLTVGRSQIRGPVVTAHVGLSGPAALDASLSLPGLPSRILLDLAL